MNRLIARVIRLPDVPEAWRPLRRALSLSRGGLAVFIIAVALSVLLARPLDRAPETVQAITAMTLAGSALAGMVVSLVGGAWRNLFRCPRCGLRFFGRAGRWGTFYTSWARRCMNCGLARWTATQSEQEGIRDANC